MKNEPAVGVFSPDDIEKIILDSYDEIYRYCYWRIKNKSDAQDLTQETFLKFVQGISTYLDQGKPKALLYTIARNLCINWHKKAGHTAWCDVDEKLSAVLPDDMERIENKVVLQQLLDELPDEQVDILLLRYGQGLKINEIAKIIGKSRFVVRNHINSSLATLRRKLNI